MKQLCDEFKIARYVSNTIEIDWRGDPLRVHEVCTSVARDAWLSLKCLKNRTYSFLTSPNHLDGS